MFADQVIESILIKTSDRIMVEDKGHHHHGHHVRTIASAEDYPLERLADPCNDRPCKDVPTPPRRPMTIENLYHTVDGKFLT